MIEPLHGIETLVLELTSNCDLACQFCQIHEKKELDLKLIARLLYENSLLARPIPRIELGGSGNPFLHKDIKKIMGLLNGYGLGTTIVTNGYNLTEHLEKVEPGLLRNTHLCIYLDSPAKAVADRLMGQGVFDRTCAAMACLKKNDIPFDIVMRVTPHNYGQLPQMLALSKELGAIRLLPMEVFPLDADTSFSLPDQQKNETLKRIETLRNTGEPVLKAIHFENPAENCTYLRKKRLFINSGGSLSFCHFLSPLKNSVITGADTQTIAELLAINNKVRDMFKTKKNEELGEWVPGRKTSSPCGFCVFCHGVNCAW